MISSKTLIIIIALVLISPVFGIILADMVGYHEPLDIAAELLRLKDISEKINWTPFFGYTVPGLPNVIGYIVSGFIGIGIILGIGYIMYKISGDLKRKRT